MLKIIESLRRGGRKRDVASSSPSKTILTCYIQIVVILYFYKKKFGYKKREAYKRQCKLEICNKKIPVLIYKVYMCVKNR